MTRSLIFIAFIAAVSIAPAKAFSETYSVLAVRVDFPFENPDHDTTSGQGEFDLRNYYGDISAQRDYRNPWDIPPHDRQYFDYHMTALNNYWSTVSEKRVEIEYDIWPRENDNAYTLSKKFYKYGNGRSKEQTYQKLVELLDEALRTCKDTEGEDIDFSKYDTFMIIHAGIGAETSGMLNDIPSAFISEDDIDAYLVSPLVIDGKKVDNGIVVPETTSGNGFGGLNGIMAQMFGHRLGLPSMSNNKDGLPAAGGWCLMDTGSMSYGYQTRGFLPTHPCVWSKIELGWLDPFVAVSDTTIDITATHIDNGGIRAVKVPITDDEYLLLENRIRYASRDSMAATVFSDSDTSGVWLAAEHYDAYIPGSGILIWHINEAIIREKRAVNEINDDMYRRGIDLLEADGRQDIGAWVGFGDPRGEYTEGHDDDTYRTSGISRLTPFTEPNSGSLWGGSSGITIQVNSDVGDVMNVSIRFGSRLKGFPVQIGESTDITAIDADNDGMDEIVYSTDKSLTFLSSSGEILRRDEQPFGMAAAISENGKAYPTFITYDTVTPTSISYFAFDGESGTINLDSLLLRMILKGPPAVSSFADGIPGFMFNSEFSTWEGVFDHSTVFRQSLSGPHYSYIEFQDSLQTSSLASAGDFVAVLNHERTLFVGQMNSSGESEEPAGIVLQDNPVYAPVIADFDRDSEYEAAVVAGRELIFVNADGTSENVHLPASPVASPSLADIDSDGYPEILLSTGRAVYAFKRGGVPVDGFPYLIPPGDSGETITTSPVIADLDGDGSLDIGVATSVMRFVAFDSDGLQADGFPIALTGHVVNTPCLFRHDSDGTLGLAYVTTDGILNAHDLGVLSDSRLMPWPMWKGGPDLANSLTNDEIHAEPLTSASFDAYCYPNPITGSSGTFRFTPENTTDCRITVFTADGSKIFDSHVPESDIIPGVPNEVKMNAEELASGLYIAKIQTRGNTVFYKFGVMK